MSLQMHITKLHYCVLTLLAVLHARMDGMALSIRNNDPVRLHFVPHCFTLHSLSPIKPLFIPFLRISSLLLSFQPSPFHSLTSRKNIPPMLVFYSQIPN